MELTASSVEFHAGVPGGTGGKGGPGRKGGSGGPGGDEQHVLTGSGV